MDRSFKTVDLFAGPGGLAEGFSALQEDGTRVFDIALSVEKEPSAFATLRLRSFFRQFETPPHSYFDYISGKISKDELVENYPEEWRRAVDETAMLELGTEAATSELERRLANVLDEAGSNTVVIGGPPCQAYSLVGRARNRGVKGYDAAGDHRHFLYREYIRILGQLKPAAFVMENVKGMLSSRVAGENIIDRILSDLRSAGGQEGSYTLVPIVEDDRGSLPGHLIRSEEYGIPQRRHRVILIGLRSDIADGIEGRGSALPLLERSVRPASVADVISGMPPLRSGLSKSKDGPAAWRTASVRAFQLAAKASRNEGSQLRKVAQKLSSYAKCLAEAQDDLPRSSTTLTAIRDNRLAEWISGRGLASLPNHESRGHMEGDLARYAFAATFAEVVGHSPKAGDFPRGLAPDHRNWESGKFADRFRVQVWDSPSTTVTSHISKDGHYFIHPDPLQCRSLTVREAARLQTFPDDYFFEGNRTQQYVQVGNAVPPLLAHEIAKVVARMLGAIQ